MRLAILADLHGNLPALEAVIAELERVQPDHVLVDGDLINAVPFSAQVIDRVRSMDWLVVRGNHEFYYLDHGTARAVPGSEKSERWGQLHWLVERVSPAQGAFLAMLPDDCTFYVPGTQPLRITHGVPRRNRVGLYRSQPDDKIAAEIGEVNERTFITAHTHVQLDRHVVVTPDTNSALSMNPHGDPHSIEPAPRHWHVVNPGSVGLALDGNPAAQFAILESVPDAVEAGGWRVAHYQAPYDRRPALEAFFSTGMLEAGGVISQLFYWELVTAETEIIRFYRWAFSVGLDPDQADVPATFARYVAETGRDRYVRERDPLHQGLPGSP